MKTENATQVLGLLLSSGMLVGCVNTQLLKQLADEFELSGRPRADYLNEKCPRQEANHLRSTECREWREARAAAAAEKRRSEEAERKAEQEAAAAAYKEQQAQKQREEEEREKAAVLADERAGYKYLSFEDFALDAAKMQGAKVALYGVYVGKGKRLASNHLAALMWTERADNIPGALIPLVTTEATRESRATFLRCDASPVGCGLVVRGRIRTVTLQNAFGVGSRELGVVVDSVR